MVSVNLERRIKKHIYGKQQAGRIVGCPGFVDLCQRESLAILNEFSKMSPETTLRDSDVLVRKVDFEALVALTLAGRCIEDVWLEISHSRARTPAEIELCLSELDVALYFTPGSSFFVITDSVASEVYSERLLKELASKIFVKKGLVAAENRSVADHVVEVSLIRDVLRVEVSLAGEVLSHRGYRKSLVAKAPLRETLAASCVATSLQMIKEWYPGFTPDLSYVPFAGSGTLGFEAVLQIRCIFPCYFTRAYGFEKLVCFKKAAIDHLRKKLQARIISGLAALHFVERDAEQLEALKLNADVFSEFASINVVLGDFFTTSVPSSESLFVPLNPPYGKRLRADFSAKAFYSDIASKLESLASQHRHVGGFLLCPDEDTWGAVLKVSRTFKTATHHFTQGGMHIRMVIFASQY